MLEIILARHGQTFWNRQGRFQGWKGTPLTPLGVRQAKKISKFLQEKKIDCIFSSDLPRAKETAAFIIQHHPEANVEFVKELRELSFGILEGKTWQEAAEEIPNLFGLDTNDAFMIPHPRGESFEQLQARVSRFLRKILKLHDKTVLLVSHDGVGRSVLQEIFRFGFVQRGAICQPHEIVYIISISESGKKTCKWFNVESGESASGFYTRSAECK